VNYLIQIKLNFHGNDTGADFIIDADNCHSEIYIAEERT